MSSLPDEHDPVAPLAAGKRFYFWASLAHHRVSSFGHFPHPPTLPARTLTAAASAPPHTREQLGGSLLSALERRRSTRTFGNTPLAQHELMTLLWATYGGLESGRRTVPSSGSVYPLRLRVVVRAVEGLAPQVYAFDHHNGELTPEPEVPAPMELQTWYVTRHVNFDGSAALVVMIGDLSRIAAVYGERGYRFLHLEAGHAGQNLCLAASLLDVPHVALGGFDDDVVNRAFHLEGSDSFVVYSVLLGCHQG